MNTAQLMRGLMLSALVISDIAAQEVVEFEGPDNAPIYVMEGDFKQTASIQQSGGTWFYQTDIAATMNVNSGAMTSVGSIQMEGSGYQNGAQFLMGMDISLAMKSVMKQAGNSVRWSGKAKMTGPMSIYTYAYGLETANIRGTWVYRNMTLDPATGEQTGVMSYDALRRDAYGQSFPIKQPPTQTTLPRPTIYASEGEWREVAGDWSSEITANVYRNKSIRGNGTLTIGDPEDPYAEVPQRIRGSISPKTGVVKLDGSGKRKATSRVKVTLTYFNATGETKRGKSSVSAYAQRRRF